MLTFKKNLFLSIISFTLFISCNQNNKETGKENNSGNYSLTIEQISKKIRKNPTNAELFSKRSELFFENQQIPEAINDLDIAIKLDSLQSDYYIKLAEYQILLGKSGKAKESLEKCERIFPENTEVLLKLAEIHLYVKQYKESMNYLTKVQNITQHIAHTYFIKGLVYQETGDTARAIENFQITVEKQPQHYEAYILLGLLYAKNGNVLAIDYYKNAIALIPQSIEAHYNLAMFYQKNNNVNKAIEEYEYIINKIDSTYKYAYFNTGYIYLESLKEYNKAITYFTKSIELDTQYFEAYYNRGYCYELLNKYEVAINNYKQALDISDNYELAIDGLNRIDKVVLK